MERPTAENPKYHKRISNSKGSVDYVVNDSLLIIDMNRYIDYLEKKVKKCSVLDDAIKCDDPTCKEPAHISHSNLCYHHKSTTQWE